MKVYLSREEVRNIIIEYVEERLMSHVEGPHTVFCMFDSEKYDEEFCQVIITEGEEDDEEGLA